MSESADTDLFRTWLAGWAACRGYTPEDHDSSVSVLRPDRGEETEHFLVEPGTEVFRALAAETRQDPARVLTVATHRMLELVDEAGRLGLRVVDRRQSLMRMDMHGQDVEDPRAPEDGITVERTREGACRHVTVHVDGEVAARGSVSVVGEYAVYDRIETEERFRRRGLGTFVMRALTAGVLEEDITTGLLMASADGRALYEFLGWQYLVDVFVVRG
ncbi:hypothetical protein AC792_14390 [Arthrobacter sp. RIT-PI-e]|uniref:GNAT family N-acetyltransferase n=1 Tax=Arthrobacter sp. RIT-PI-e TaxID=1681197 RepID=UPI0006769E59|nr:GNAT family N-acetyltransferase [Arthrobacter sp. RIT-PI-e]KNC17271.1 hypothetical protein AC792_14390 [Arthrobacter sp. RIT-PI-e]